MKELTSLQCTCVNPGCVVHRGIAQCANQGSRFVHYDEGDDGELLCDPCSAYLIMSYAMGCANEN